MAKKISSKTKDGLTIFEWQGLDKRGTVMKGEIQSKSEGLARAELRKQN